MNSGVLAAAASAGAFFSRPAPDAIYTPENAPLVALAFLGAGAGLLAAAGGAGLALALKRRRLAARAGAAALIGAALYAALLLSASLSSRERVLPRGARKYFCEIDCHLAYSLESVDTKKTSDGGEITVARVRTWFDPSTIASFRGNGPLFPNPRQVYVLDAAGRRYRLSPSGKAAFDSRSTEPAGFPGHTGFSAPLTPGQSCDTLLAFELPQETRSPTKPLRLFVGDPEGVERFLIGHENSFLHRKAYFALGT